MISKVITPSQDLQTAQTRFLDQVRDWAYASIDRYRDALPSDVHDQATYTTAWAPYVAAKGDTRLMDFLCRLRDQIHDHFTETGQWHHGYWCAQEAHHGTEHFDLFLGTLYHLNPDDAHTKAQILDAAEHIGNWAPEIPTWFDESTGLFRSMYLGTRVVRVESGMALNIPDHLRFVSLCLLAYRAGGGSRYLDFAAKYTTRWVCAVLEGDQIPLGLTPQGPLTELVGESEAAYRSFVGMVGHLDDDLDRTENLLASNGIGVMLQLWQLTGQPSFLHAAERLLDLAATQLADPDAGPAADALRTYRRITGSARYDGVLTATFENAAAVRDPYALGELGIVLDTRRSERPHGIGKRADMPEWFEDGQPRRHSPITLSVVAEVRGDPALALRALDLARTYFELARETLPDGRHHGCAANTVSAVARGHGRNNNAGMVTAVLSPLLSQTCSQCPS